MIIALAAVAWGILDRARSARALRAEAAESAAPLVSVSYPAPAPPVEEIELPGQVRAALETTIFARVSGYVRAWKVDIGDRVRKGQVLAIIDAPELDEQLRQAEADLRSASANAAVARTTADRVAGLVATSSVSRQEGEDRAAVALSTAAVVASNQANVRRLQALRGFERVVAPYDGVVTARATDVGQLVDAGGTEGVELFRIAEASRLRVYVDAPQSDAAVIRVGSSAQLSFADRPGKVYPATVSRTASALDPQSRTLHVELELDNSTGELFPGSFAEVKFRLPHASPALRVPPNALVFGANGVRVATVGPNHRIGWRAIMTGRDFGTAVEVTEGLGPHDQVVLNPPGSLIAGERVRIAAAATGANQP